MHDPDGNEIGSVPFLCQREIRIGSFDHRSFLVDSAARRSATRIFYWVVV